MLSIIEDTIGTAVDPIVHLPNPVRSFTFFNGNDMAVQVINLGATITSIRIPDKWNKVEDVVLGYDKLHHYLNGVFNPYFGATVGRVAGRIGNAQFKLDGKEYTLSKNFRNRHTLHGGGIGFNMAHWSVEEVDKQNCALVLQHISPDKHAGFPGELTVRAHFQLHHNFRFTIKYTATTTDPTPISLTNHSYFNLAGHHTRRGAVYDHLIAINADRITTVDLDSIPDGKLLDVKGTMFDFKELKELGQQMMKTGGDGFDVNYCCNVQNNKLTSVARALHVKSGRYLDLHSDQPGLQFYTANHLPDANFGQHFFPGKEGAFYYKQGAFCFEPQGYPDAINHPNFPNTVLRPGETYEHNIVYQFGVVNLYDRSHWLRKF